MAGRGPAPQQQHQRERDTRRRQSDVVSVSMDGEIRGPDLVGPYSEETLAWYLDWQVAPQAALFANTDWRRLLLLAPIVDSYFRKPSAAALSEIRLNEERLGATYVDRLRAKIRIESDGGQADAEVVQLHSVSREDVMARMKGKK
jgi:hypothetical protein